MKKNSGEIRKKSRVWSSMPTIVLTDEVKSVWQITVLSWKLLWKVMSFFFSSACLCSSSSLGLAHSRKQKATDDPIYLLHPIVDTITGFLLVTHLEVCTFARSSVAGRGKGSVGQSDCCTSVRIRVWIPSTLIRISQALWPMNYNPSTVGTGIWGFMAGSWAPGSVRGLVS